jgi:hypothetical protein
VRHCFGHAPDVAGRAHATTFAGVRDQEIMLTLVAVRLSEAVADDAAVEIDLVNHISDIFVMHI